MQHTGEKPVEKLSLHVYAGAGASQLYEDDGHSTAYASGEYRVTSFECRKQGPGELTVAVQSEGSYRPTYTRWEWVVHGLAHAPERALADGQLPENLSWDEASRTLRFESGQVQRVELS
jgi:alpha-glucosidase